MGETGECRVGGGWGWVGERSEPPTPHPHPPTPEAGRDEGSGDGVGSLRSPTPRHGTNQKRTSVLRQSLRAGPKAGAAALLRILSAHSPYSRRAPPATHTPRRRSVGRRRPESIPRSFSEEPRTVVRPSFSNRSSCQAPRHPTLPAAGDAENEFGPVFLLCAATRRPGRSLKTQKFLLHSPGIHSASPRA